MLRQGFHNDIWIASIEKKLRDSAVDYVIPDTRFPNEVELITSLGGQIWWIKRGASPDWFVEYQNGGSAIRTQDIHPSEYMWARSHFDAVIANDGSIDELTDRVKEQLAQQCK